MTGYERYTITPFGSSRAWPVIADAAIVDEPVVSIGGGGFGINLHLAPADLIAALQATVADVSQPDTSPTDPAAEITRRSGSYTGDPPVPSRRFSPVPRSTSRSRRISRSGC